MFPSDRPSVLLQGTDRYKIENGMNFVHDSVSSYTSHHQVQSQRGRKLQRSCKHKHQRKPVPFNLRVYDSEQWRRPQPSSFYPPRSCALLAANYCLQTVRDKTPLRRPNIYAGHTWSADSQPLVASDRQDSPPAAA